MYTFEILLLLYFFSKFVCSCYLDIICVIEWSIGILALQQQQKRINLTKNFIRQNYTSSYFIENVLNIYHVTYICNWRKSFAHFHQCLTVSILPELNFIPFLFKGWWIWQICYKKCRIWSVYRFRKWTYAR